MLKDVIAGKTNSSFKTGKLRGKSIVRGGVGAASRTVGLLSGILTYAVRNRNYRSQSCARNFDSSPKICRSRRLSDAEYQTLGSILRAAGKNDRYRTGGLIRQLADRMPPVGDAGAPLGGSRYRSKLFADSPTARRSVCATDRPACRGIPRGAQREDFKAPSSREARRTTHSAVSPITGEKIFPRVRPWWMSRRMSFATHGLRVYANDLGFTESTITGVDRSLARLRHRANIFMRWTRR